MSEKLYPGSSQRIDDYEFTYIFPNQKLSEIQDAFRRVQIDAEDFIYLPLLYADRINPQTKSMIQDRIAALDGMTIGEAQASTPTVYDNFCAGAPSPSPEQQAVFREDLGAAVSAIDHGAHTADLLLDWVDTNNAGKKSKAYASEYEQDLLVAAGLFHDASDIILGLPEMVNGHEVTDELKARVLRELLYMTFDQHESEAHLLASTTHTNDYCDPFHHDVDEAARIHEQFLAATALDYAITGHLAYLKAPIREQQGGKEQAMKYRWLGAHIARIVVPTLVDVNHTYPAVKKHLQDKSMMRYIMDASRIGE